MTDNVSVDHADSRSALSADVPDSVRLETSSCPLGCAAGEGFVLSSCDKLHGLPGRFDVVRCDGCGLMRTNPRPTPDTIGYYYPSDYGPYLGTKVLDTPPPSGIRRKLAPLVRRLFDDFSQRMPDIRPTAMLELGCASGAFLHRMAAKGWSVEGIEFAEDPASAARALGFQVQTGALENASPPRTPVDLVVGWMVLEHLHDPVGCLKKLAEWTRPGATLVVSVPNANCLEFRLFSRNWYALQVPTHLSHFTPSTLAALLEASGWSLEKVFHQRSFSNLCMSAAYYLEEKGSRRPGALMRALAFPAGVWFYLLFPVAWVLGALGQSGRMTVWAKRRDCREDSGLNRAAESFGPKETP